MENMEIDELIKIGKNKKIDNETRLDCAKKYIKSLFDIDISEDMAREALLGEGLELDKFFEDKSSSKQSLSIFSQVSNVNKIIIDNIEYNEVHFEYENKVIECCKSSSLDVVLLSAKGKDGKRDCLCIESKYSEHFDTTSPQHVVGASYLSNNENGYYKKLSLTTDELINIGLDISKTMIDDFKNKTARKVSKIMKDYNKEHGYVGKTRDGKEKLYNTVGIKVIDDNTYVYSDGIKQILSHIIGIINMHEPGEKCSKFLKDEDFKTIRFITMDNEYLNHSKNSKVANDVHKHEKALYEILRTKNYKCGDTPIELLDHMTYQELYQNNKSYFKNIQNVVDYYSLDWKEEK